MKRSSMFRTPPQVIKSKWEGNVTHAEEKGNAFSMVVGNMKGRDHLKDLNTDASALRCGKISYIFIYIINIIYILRLLYAEI